MGTMNLNKEYSAEKFVSPYLKLYESIKRSYQSIKGEKIAEYKELEPEILKQIFLNYVDEEGIINQCSKICSQLIRSQSLPNANHRTAFLFIKLYLRKQDIRMYIYEEKKSEYDKFYRTSKEIIDTMIEHNELFNRKYMDVHHSIGIEEHEKKMDRLMREIIQIPQSGIVAAESFHSFIASMNQEGSLPGGNQ